MKIFKSKCCGTAVRTSGGTTQHFICTTCNQACDVIIQADSGGGSIGGGNVDHNLNIQ